HHRVRQPSPTRRSSELGSLGAAGHDSVSVLACALAGRLPAAGRTGPEARRSNSVWPPVLTDAARPPGRLTAPGRLAAPRSAPMRWEEDTSELRSHLDMV